MEVSVRIGVNFFRELTAGETWTVHPAGGIIVFHPERKPLWCRMENGGFMQDWIEPVTAGAQEAT